MKYDVEVKANIASQTILEYKNVRYPFSSELDRCPFTLALEVFFDLVRKGTFFDADSQQEVPAREINLTVIRDEGRDRDSFTRPLYFKDGKVQVGTPEDVENAFRLLVDENRGTGFSYESQWTILKCIDGYNVRVEVDPNDPEK